MSRNGIEIAEGMRFNRLTALAREGSTCGHRTWRFVCDCGREHVAAVSAVGHGHVKSCGCLNNELRLARNTKHGMACRGKKNPPEYWVWRALIRRCEDPLCPDWEWYGARGIRVSPLWRHDFGAFMADMGPRPSSSHSIDRTNNDRGYEPGNCRWATSSEQAFNRRPKRWNRREKS